MKTKQRTDDEEPVWGDEYFYLIFLLISAASADKIYSIYIDRSTFVRRRQVEMSVIALMMYTDSVLSSECDAITIKQIEAEEIEKGKGMDNESDQVGMIDNTLNTRKSKKPTNIINAQSFASIFLADDKIMASDHMTEFWY